MSDPAASTAIYTIGHSTRGLDELVALLDENGVVCLVDIRAYPGSRTNPQFNKENLERELPAAGIEYQHLRPLGGRRKDAERLDPSPNSFWDNRSFRNYADHALSPAFRASLADLKRLAERKTCAIMCSEAVWWRCHRRIVSDYLLADGFRVLHIMDRGKTTPAKLTEGARVISEDAIVYDREPGGTDAD